MLVPTRMRGRGRVERGVEIRSPEHLDGLVSSLASRNASEPLDARRFLSARAHRPMPSLVRAARELFLERRPPQLWKSAANTDEAVRAVQATVQRVHETGTRRLVLVRGVPGSGKTLVGLRLAHMPVLDELSLGEGVPAVFLAGNGPLVQVLQYVLKGAGAGGKTFVRPIRDHVKRYAYAASRRLAPAEHVIIFDEAQRAHDRERVADVHGQPLHKARSELHHFIDFAQRVPGWYTTVGLIGDGQEIHVGEESGLRLWASATRESARRDSWTVHGAAQMAEWFQGLPFEETSALRLDSTIRSHFASHLHRFVAELVRCPPASTESLRRLASRVEREGHDLRITRDLTRASKYGKPRKNKYSRVMDPLRLRANAYRVLLTRGRNAHVAYVPDLSCLDATMAYLVDSGFRPLR